ncbi:SAF domain-containing protein [Demequina capsici]|uniref:SAF domain-containing protein n=1 Tax=Demequina capsici TaxID=3075620 RepID=A0AA96J8X6_9MICO|nr:MULTISPECIES: SAF domain-containing protein [unclassified Demequina]WNM23858.1 SAF domain-containing protein [Demequina sp. OYTSA14]WNM26697.1 SAF domain-containing protein [Demequina sp. PMTSA13]
MSASARPARGRLAPPSWRDPRLLIGIVLIAASVAGVVSLVRAADSTAPVYMAVRELPAGTVLDQEDLVVAHVRVDAGTYVGATEQPWGQVLTRPVGVGELVPAGALSSVDAYDARPVAVRTTRPVAQGIGPGSIVDVWVTVVDEDGQPSSRLVGEQLAVDAVEADDAAFAGSGAQTVYVIVPQDRMEAFLDALAVDGDLSVVGLAG